ILFFTAPATPAIYTLSLHDALPIFCQDRQAPLGPALEQEALSFFANGQLVRAYRIRELVRYPDRLPRSVSHFTWLAKGHLDDARSEEHTSELQSQSNLVCRLLLEKK